jgi:putative redox protein
LSRRQICAGHPQLAADEPPPVGDDTGRWPLQEIRVTLRHSRIHAKDCADCDTTHGYIHQIDCDVQLTGDLDDTQRLLYIAERCPVHQTLTSEVRITTSLS